MYYYEVAPLSIIRADSNTLTYCSPSKMSVGQFVGISVGKKTLIGLVVRSTKKPQYETKTVSSYFEIPPLPGQLVETALWMAHYYTTHLATVMQTVLPRGITKKRRISAVPVSQVSRDRTNFVLNKHQCAAVEKIESMSPGTALLHGITGSGKTAVYIELAKRTLARHQSVVILVPEIALTSQLVAELTQHLPRVHVTHSKQTEAERHLTWLTVAQSNEPVVVIGPRSALFMPAANIGLIVIDEAHEPSFKQDQSPRYSALRVASRLADLHQARVVQGSATPLVAEYYLAKERGRPIIEMTEKARHDATAPHVTVIDMTKRSHFNRHRIFSDELLAGIEQQLAHGSQVLIFHNRRGSASTTLCERCGWSAICPRCFVPYTLHADRHLLECHICGNRERVPTSCPECHSTDIKHKGIGTKLIESELQQLFPKASVARFDGDAAADATVEKRYQELYDGTIDIIIGTQVIAKGLDLPHLKLVGVVQADAGLALPDYAASERTFQLLAQVVGRVGRSSHQTTVIVQSYQPHAPAVARGLNQDYENFYQETIHERQRALFPPFRYLLKLTCVYKTEAAAIRNAKHLAALLRTAYPDVQILGPTPAFYERQHDTYRWQLLVKATLRADLLNIVQSVPATHWQVDLDPSSLL